MKLLGLTGLLFLISHSVFAQSAKVEIRFLETNEVLINEASLGENTSIETLTAALGEPSKVVNYPSGEVSYFYEEVGIVFFTVDKIVKGLGINFNSDGDERFPEQSFTGSLKIGKTDIYKDTTSEAIASITSPAFACPAPMMCASKDRRATVASMVSFEDEKLTQLLFLLK